MAFYNENGESFDDIFVKDYEFIDNMAIAGNLISCGYNGNGQLGINNITTYSTFQTVHIVSGVKQVTVGYNHTFASLY